MASVDYVETHSFTRQLVLILAASFVTYIAIAYTQTRRKMSNEQVLDEIQRFLRTSRLNNLIKLEDESYLKAIELAWINDPYKGPIKKLSIAEWLDQSRTAILSR